MSRDNRVTPALLTAWVAALRRDPYVGEAFLASLASAGEGTIRDRFPSGSLSCEIRAKTGYLSGVRAISGVLTSDESRRTVAFSILMNETSVKDAQARRLQQTLVRLIDEWVSRQSFAGVPAPR
jgi:D-alanyl-D-alanine carboxypeptidase/D-alanyl-D-alanine-endopeptidase (penicillin-binding protein 4)